MAYTIVQQPNNTWLPAYNEIVYQVSSSNYTQPNHKYIAQIKIDGSIVHTEKTIGHPSNGDGVFEISRLVNSYLSCYVLDQDSTDGIIKATGQYAQLIVVFGEEYGTTITQYLTLATSTTKYIWYGGLTPRDQNEYDTADLVAKDVNSYILSTRPATMNIYQDQYDWMYFINDNTIGDVDKIVITAYTPSTSSVVEIGNDFNADKSVLIIPSGFNLNNVRGTFIDFGAQPILPTGTTHYTIQLKKSTGAVMSQPYIRYVYDECVRFDEFDLCWLNRWGGKDSFRCTMITDESVESVKQTYKKSVYGMSAGSWTKDTNARAYNNYSTVSSDIWTLRTNFLTDDEAELFRDLFDSPVITLRDGTKQYEVNFIGSTVFEKRRIEQENLIKFEIKVRFAESYQRQRP